MRAFLMSEPAHTGKLATTRKDGSPHVAPIWFVVDDDGSILFHTGENTLKGRTLRRDPRAALCVDDERPPFSFVIVNGTVEMSDDLAEQSGTGPRSSAAATWAPTRPRRTARATPSPASCSAASTPTNIVSEEGVAVTAGPRWSKQERSARSGHEVRAGPERPADRISDGPGASRGRDAEPIGVGPHQLVSRCERG